VQELVWLQPDQAVYWHWTPLEAVQLLTFDQLLATVTAPEHAVQFWLHQGDEAVHTVFSW